MEKSIESNVISLVVSLVFGLDHRLYIIDGHTFLIEESPLVVIMVPHHAFHRVLEGGFDSGDTELDAGIMFAHVLYINDDSSARGAFHPSPTLSKKPRYLLREYRGSAGLLCLIIPSFLSPRIRPKRSKKPSTPPSSNSK
jgi:hypothetical protein